jgi:hypothetical protein
VTLGFSTFSASAVPPVPVRLMSLEEYERPGADEQLRFTWLPVVMQLFFAADAFSAYRGWVGVGAQAAVIVITHTTKAARNMIALPRRR